MYNKYKIGTLVYSKYDCLGMIIDICKEPYNSRYLVEWFCREIYGSYTEKEIDNLRKNLFDIIKDD